MENSIFKAAPAPKPALVYAAPDTRGIQLLKLGWSRDLRRGIVAGKVTVRAALERNTEGYVKATLQVKQGDGRETAYGTVTSGYHIGEMVGEKRVAKVTFERLTDRHGELGKSGVAFAFLYTFEGLADIAHELTSRSL